MTQSKATVQTIIKIKASNNTALPNQYIDYKTQPQQFIKKIIKKKDKNINPLYSAQSFQKYFDKVVIPKYTEPTQQFVKHKQKNKQTNKHILQFNKLQQEVKKVKKQYSSRKIYKKIDVLQQFIQRSQEHFLNLNIDDGIDPRNSFSRQNLKISKYISQLLMPPKTQRIRFHKTNKSVELRRKVHTENIIQYLKKQKIESRYFNVPKLQAEKQDREDLQCMEKTNKLLRSKSLYCQAKYKPPYLKKQKLDAQIMTQTRKYMSKLPKQKSSIKNTY